MCDFIVGIKLHYKHVVNLVVSENFDTKWSCQNEKYYHEQKSKSIEISQSNLKFIK